MSAWTFEAAPDARGATLRVRHDGQAAARLRVDTDTGTELPRHWYRLGRLVLASPELGVHHRLRTLLLCNDLTGAVELSAIETEPQIAGALRARALARLLAAAVLWVQASGRTPADERVIAELPGVRDAGGRAPFWEALGRHFYDGEPAVAAERFGAAWRTHVAALLPRETLLASFLAEDAQRSLGVPASTAAELAHALRAAGLRDGDFVTLEDGGPVHAARLDVLAELRGLAQVALRRAPDDAAPRDAWLLATGDGIVEVHGTLQGAVLVVRSPTLATPSERGADSTYWVARVDARG